MAICEKTEKFAKGLARLTGKWDDAFIDRVFGQTLRRGTSWEKMLRDIAEFDEPDKALDGLKQIYQRMNPQNRGNVGRIFFDKDAHADEMIYRYKALDGPRDRERFLRRWLEMENANVKGLNTVANALNGNNSIRATDFVMDFADNGVGGKLNLIGELELTTPAGKQGIDLAFKQRVRLPDGSYMKFGEFKSGPNQPIDPQQGLSHLESIVREANGNATGVDYFRFVLNRPPGDSSVRTEAFRFLRALVEGAGQGSANQRRAIDRILNAVKAQVGTDPRAWKGQLIAGNLTAAQEQAVDHVLAKFFVTHFRRYPSP